MSESTCSPQQLHQQLHQQQQRQQSQNGIISDAIRFYNNLTPEYVQRAVGQRLDYLRNVSRQRMLRVSVNPSDSQQQQQRKHTQTNTATASFSPSVVRHHHHHSREVEGT